MNPKYARVVLLGSVLLTMNACQMDEQTASLPGSGGTGTQITRKDGIYVTGVIQRVADGVLQVNDEAWQLTAKTQLLPSPSTLQVGQVVYLRSSPDRELIQLWLRPQAQGAIEWIDAEAQQLSIEGAVIEWTDQTLWNIGRGEIAEGQSLQIFGEITQYRIKATRIERVSEPATPQLTLRIDGIDATEHLLSQGGMSYAYDPLLPETQLPKINQCIHAQLAPRPSPITAGVYALSSFEQDQGLRHDAAALIQGEIDSLKTPALFQLGCYRVHTDANTLWQKISPQALSNGQAVRVEGLMRDDGALQAVYIWPVHASDNPPK